MALSKFDPKQPHPAFEKVNHPDGLWCESEYYAPDTGLLCSCVQRLGHQGKHYHRSMNNQRNYIWSHDQAVGQMPYFHNPQEILEWLASE